MSRLIVRLASSAEAFASAFRASLALSDSALSRAAVALTSCNSACNCLASSAEALACSATRAVSCNYCTLTRVCPSGYIVGRGNDVRGVELLYCLVPSSAGLHHTSNHQANLPVKKDENFR